MENRYPIIGTIVDIGEVKQISPYLRKREFKIRFSDTDFTNKIQERVIRFTTINDHNSLLDSCKIDEVVEVQFYLEGRDITKDGKVINFTNLICYEIKILSSNTRDTKEDKDAIITGEGREYKPVIKPATDEELAGYMVEGDPLVSFPEGPGGEKEIKKNEQIIDDLPF
jgi:hypothetical protein